MRRIAVLAAIVAGGCDEPPPAPPRELAAGTAVAEFTLVGDWPSSNRDLAGTRYSSLKEIDTVNVGDLRQAWSYDLGSDADAEGLSARTPLVVDGVLYATAGDRVVALDADTGEELWRHALVPPGQARRGLAYWPGDITAPARIFVTVDRRLIALDAASGNNAEDFGTGGAIDLPAAYDAAPARFEQLLIVGSNGAPGGVRAFDARTGAPAWAFEAAAERPLRSLHSFTIDVDRALLYAVLDDSGTDDYYGGNRSAESSMGDSIVALAVRSGDLRWRFQAVHHDVWGYDLSAPPGLLDARINGAVVPLLVQAGGTGYLYVLNRVTGEPIFGIAETPMPLSDVPGERASPTQPIPVKPPPIARVSFVADELVDASDTSEAHAASCRELAERGGEVRNLGPFTPYGYRAPGAEPRAHLVFPTAFHGAAGGGTAADPSLGLVFVASTSEGSIGWIERNSADSTAAQTGGGPRTQQLPYRRMTPAADEHARFAASAGTTAGSDDATALWPCQKPPWGELVAMQAATGDIAWRVPLGITEELPEERQRTGRRNVGGPTSTAGGLVFIGASDDRRFRAFDSSTGEELWSTALPRSAHSVPVTYLGDDGKQYVAVVAAGASANSNDPRSIIAYALP